MQDSMITRQKQANKQGYNFIIGIDEAGRGPLAGPVVAAAVCLKRRKFKNKITDSKKMSDSARQSAYLEIYKNAYVGVGIISETVIDEHNILNATFLAMRNAVDELISRIPKKPRGFKNEVCLLVDGNRFRSDLPYAYKTIIGGDRSVLSISCASIIAKVTRDRILRVYDQVFPQYGFKQHKGYPTLDHKRAIKTHGRSIIHRRSFKCQ